MKKPVQRENEECVSPSRTGSTMHSPLKKSVSKPYGHKIEIIPGKLYWISDEKPPINIPNAFFFNIDNDLTYMPFNKDFGPLNLAMVHRYVREV